MSRQKPTPLPRARSLRNRCTERPRANLLQTIEGTELGDGIDSADTMLAPVSWRCCALAACAHTPTRTATPGPRNDPADVVPPAEPEQHLPRAADHLPQPQAAAAQRRHRRRQDAHPGRRPHPRPVRRPVRSHARRLQARRRRAPAVEQQLNWFANPSRLSRARLRARRAVPVPHRHRARSARHAAGDRAAAGRRERLRAVRLFARPRLGAVAVHSRHRLALRPEAGLVV